jgi:hypothetical protein
VSSGERTRSVVRSLGSPEHRRTAADDGRGRDRQNVRSGVSQRPAGSLDDGVQAGMRAPAGSAVQVCPQVPGAGLVGLGVPLPPAQLLSQVKADLTLPVLRILPDGLYPSVRFSPKRMPTAYRGYP